MHRVVLIPGDGIGPEVAAATRTVIDATGVALVWDERTAGASARANHRRKVTVGHKANVMRYSDGLFLRAAQDDAAEYPDVPWEDIHIDHLSARLVRRPQDFDVLLLPNLYGDILSDLCAGLVGG